MARDMKDLEAALEGILFAAGEPIHIDRICSSLEINRSTAEKLLGKLHDYYAFERRGIRLIHMENDWQLCTAPEYAAVIRRTFEIRKSAKLSQPALEVLAIVAYFQPVTRAYIEQIRGVDSSYTVGLLLERELIREAGRLAVPGRPMQFRTTKNFLRAFGLASLDDLPDLASASQEDMQLTMEMESALRRLQEAEAGGEGGAAEEDGT